MRLCIFSLTILLLAFLTLPNALAASPPDLPNVITLSYESILSDSSVKPLATVSYNPQTLKASLLSWKPPLLPSALSSSDATSFKLLRIILPSGSSTLTTVSTFNTTLAQSISLHLSPSGDGTVYSASISSYHASTEGIDAPLSSKPKSKPRSDAESKVKINVIPPRAGPTAKLNTRKPPVVGTDGREVVPESEQPEKSFFQKYWWVFILVTVVAMAGGGDK